MVRVTKIATVTEENKATNIVVDLQNKNFKGLSFWFKGRNVGEAENGSFSLLLGIKTPEGNFTTELSIGWANGVNPNGGSGVANVAVNSGLPDYQTGMIHVPKDLTFDYIEIVSTLNSDEGTEAEYDVYMALDR